MKTTEKLKLDGLHMTSFVTHLHENELKTIEGGTLGNHAHGTHNHVCLHKHTAENNNNGEVRTNGHWHCKAEKT